DQHAARPFAHGCHRRRRWRQRPRHDPPGGHRGGPARQAGRGTRGRRAHRPWRPHRTALPPGLPATGLQRMKPIHTERLVLRNWEERDRDLFFRINSEEEVMEFFPFRRDRAEADAKMDEMRAENAAKGYGWTAAE